MANVYGDNGDNWLDGTNAADTIYGYAGSDIIFAWGGDDLVDAGEHNDSVWGGAGNDTLKGGGGSDGLCGQSDNDTLKGGGGADHLDGGTGFDTASYFYSPAGVVVSLIGDTAYGGDATGDELNNIENLIGSGHGDTLFGDNFSNELSGLDGNDNLKGFGGGDHLLGGRGDDYLDGGADADVMVGGEGNDTYIVDNWWDVVTEAGGEGLDEVRTSVSWTLTAGADVETLRTTDDAGFSPISLTGNASGNNVFGNAGSNVINGGDGDDTLTGLGGADSFRFDTQLDADFNLDVITDFNVAADTILLDDAIFSAFANGPLAAERFVVGIAAQDANDNIIFNSGTGVIYYDSDGNGAAAPIQFAVVDAGLALTHLDFIVV
jgi:serralysin